MHPRLPPASPVKKKEERTILKVKKIRVDNERVSSDSPASPVSAYLDELVSECETDYQKLFGPNPTTSSEIQCQKPLSPTPSTSCETQSQDPLSPTPSITISDLLGPDSPSPQSPLPSTSSFHLKLVNTASLLQDPSEGFSSEPIQIDSDDDDDDFSLPGPNGNLIDGNLDNISVSSPQPVSPPRFPSFPNLEHFPTLQPPTPQLRPILPTPQLRPVFQLQPIFEPNLSIPRSSSSFAPPARKTERAPVLFPHNYVMSQAPFNIPSNSRNYIPHGIVRTWDSDPFNCSIKIGAPEHFQFRSIRSVWKEYYYVCDGGHLLDQCNCMRGKLQVKAYLDIDLASQRHSGKFWGQRNISERPT